MFIETFLDKTVFDGDFKRKLMQVTLKGFDFSVTFIILLKFHTSDLKENKNLKDDEKVQVEDENYTNT